MSERPDRHDGWTPEPQEQVQPGDPWRDPAMSEQPDPLREALERIARINDRDFDAAQDIARAALDTPAPDRPLNASNGPWCGCGQPLGHAVPNVDCTDTPAPDLDVRRVVQAITNIAARHGLVKDPPAVAAPLATIYGYSRATPDMDAEIAAEYARLTDLDRP